MKTIPTRYKIFIVGVFIAFMLLHQADKLIIGQVLEDVQRDFSLDDAQAGAIGTGALIVGAICYLLWGYLYDRYARPKMLALASFIWGITTSLSAIATTFPAFLAARSSTGIDDSSYPGIYSLVADYFPPESRGRINGMLQLTAPVGFVLSLVLVLALDGLIGWRNIFLLTGGLGIVVGVFILFGVKDRARGSAEPELRELDDIPTYKFQWQSLTSLRKRKTLFPLLAQGFFGVFPLQVITFWFFSYLERERGFDSGVIFPIMAAAVVMMSIGAVVAGSLGDRFSRRSRRGRLVVAATGIGISTVLLPITLLLPPETSPLIFGAFLACTAFFVLFSGPNVIATIHDVTPPEVRSSALSVQYFVENIGAAGAPWLVGLISTQVGLSTAILIVAGVTYVLCLLFMLLAVRTVAHDVDALRGEMRLRTDEIMAVRG
ncbi:MAG: MFS transporter [Anaerolinea sp.]|nr:MFS transporter [Anaerolinea sp.]